eukprot:1183934-Prorocentrum_minimum.AAC.1
MQIDSSPKFPSSRACKLGCACWALFHPPYSPHAFRPSAVATTRSIAGGGGGLADSPPSPGGTPSPGGASPGGASPGGTSPGGASPGGASP